MNWGDTIDIAIALYEKYPDTDPQYVRYTDLLEWVLKLDGFKGTAEECNEKRLEAVQMAWIEEAS